MAKVNQFLSFKLETNECAIAVENVREVLEYRAITPIPRTADFMKGIINVRGAGIPVIDLHTKFRLMPLTVTRDTAIIVMESTGKGGQSIVFGALADNVQEVIEFKDDVLEATPKFGNRIPASFLKGMGKKEQTKANEDVFVAVLNIDTLFSDDEVKSLESVTRQNSK